MHKISQNIKAQIGIAPQVATSDVTGTGFDTLGFDTVAFVVNIGACSGTAATCIITIQECDTVGGTYANISGAAFTTLTGTSDGSMGVLEVDLRPGARKRFLRVLATIAGTSPSYALDVIALLGRAESLPVTQPTVSA